MGFYDIKGHDRILETLRASVRGNKVHHAHLFAGPHGVGKRSTALAFARALNCESLKDDACGVCGSCRKILAGVHPDVTVVGEDRAKLQLLVDEVRDKILRFVSLKRYEGRYRVVILLDAERLNPNASNALLKTLEEPPPQTVFVVTCVRLSAVLPTLRSRCQKLPFGPLPVQILEQVLIDREGIERDEARQMARLGNGSIGAALSHTPERLTAKNVFLQAVAAAGTTPDTDPLLLAQRLATDKAGTLDQLELMNQLIRDIGCQIVKPGHPLLHPDQFGVVAEFTRRLSVSGLLTLSKRISDLRSAITLNLTPATVLEQLFLEFARVNRSAYG